MSEVADRLSWSSRAIAEATICAALDVDRSYPYCEIGEDDAQAAAQIQKTDDRSETECLRLHRGRVAKAASPAQSCCSRSSASATSEDRSSSPPTCPFDEWTEVLGSERLTGALLDRLTHHVHILEMNGQSYRLSQSRQAQHCGLPGALPTPGTLLAPHPTPLPPAPVVDPMTRFSPGDIFAGQLCRGGTFLLRHVSCFLAALDRRRYQDRGCLDRQTEGAARSDG